MKLPTQASSVFVTMLQGCPLTQGTWIIPSLKENKCKVHLKLFILFYQEVPLTRQPWVQNSSWNCLMMGGTVNRPVWLLCLCWECWSNGGLSSFLGLWTRTQVRLRSWACYSACGLLRNLFGFLNSLLKYNLHAYGTLIGSVYIVHWFLVYSALWICITI